MADIDSKKQPKKDKASRIEADTSLSIYHILTKCQNNFRVTFILFTVYTRPSEVTNLMPSLRVGFVTTASIYEAGVNESEARMDSAVESLRSKGLKVIAAKPVLTDQSRLLEVVNTIKREDIDLLIIMNGTWSADSLQIEIVREVRRPLLLWALPYPETFSLASVQHIGSVLRQMRIPFEYIYGEPDDDKTVLEVAKIAQVASLAKLWRNMRVGRVGKRFTWRTAGPTDITYDELDLKLAPGPSVVHIDIDELFSIMSKISDDEAQLIISNMRKAGKLGKLEVNEKPLLEAAKVYPAVKELLKRYALDALTIECYPKYCGIDNLASAWLAEEGVVSACESDLGHTAVWTILQKLSNMPVALLEPVKILDDENAILCRHEGSGAPSLSKDISEVFVKPVTDERGALIFSAVKPGIATIATIWGRNGRYELFISKVEVLETSLKEIERIGGILAKLRFNMKAKDVIDKMINIGIDHHWMLTHGDCTNDLIRFCNMMEIEPVSLGSPDLLT